MKKQLHGALFAAALLMTHLVAAGETAQPEVSTAEGPISIINLNDLEKEAARVLPRGAFGYVQGGAEDEVTMDANATSFNRVQIIPNGLTGLESVSMQTRFLGVDLPSPVILAPMAAHGLVHRDADKATIRGTQKAGTIMAISTYSSVPIKDTVESAPGAPFLFQIYMSRDDGFNRHVLEQATAAGARAIVITVDSGAPGNREADARNNYNYSMHTPIVMDYYDGENVTQTQARASRKVGFTGDDIRTVKQITGLPVLVKGILSPEAAVLAVNAGADGIWVSNHGGRQMDAAPAAFDMLPLIAKAVGKRVPIVFDSGIRRGSHVFKALASGADIVALGRPALYGLALGGSEGVADVFRHLNGELNTVMILAGTPDVEAVKRAKLFDPEKREIIDRSATPPAAQRVVTSYATPVVICE
ncbi:MAG: alpha-hydroxy-acid oxidizing protein [Planctomycetaceae bacterium]|nr:alpha-hydroxy-acid oxidizing protein [Planctomycetaceae bacterium]